MISDLSTTAGLGSSLISSRWVSTLLPYIGLGPSLGLMKGFSKSKYIKTALGILYASVAYKLLALIKRYLLRILIRRATIEEHDQAFKWLLIYLSKHRSFTRLPSDVGIYARLPSTFRRDAGAGDFEDQSLVALSSQTQDKLSSRRLKAEKREKEAGRGIFFLPSLSNDKTFFWYERTLFWVTREIRRDDDLMHLSCLSFDMTSIIRLMREARGDYLDQEDDKTEILRVDEHRLDWRKVMRAPSRPIDTLHLPSSLKKEILDDVRAFYTDEVMQLYHKLKVPYRKGYLFYGPPGNGKSSLCKALATELGEPICILQLSSDALNDDKFLTAMSNLPSRCILLIEDIDAVYNKRQAPSTDDGKKKAGISFDVLLNALDGVNAAEGRLLLITTNHIEQLDKALIREGRIDRRFELKNATKEQAKNLFLHCFQDRAKCRQEVALQADEFAQSIPPYKYSIVALQTYLLRNAFDPSKAVRDVEVWMSVKDAESNQEGIKV